MANFTILDCEQRSDAWHAVRAGILTASVASDMLAKPTRSGSEAACRRDLRLRLCIERLTGQPAEDAVFVSAAMARGVELEAEARGAYEAATGTLVQEVGFVRDESLPIGCSPDGVIGTFDGGLEVKCPKSATHLGYLRNPGKLPVEYVPQVTHTLFVTGAPWWDFCSYDPRFPEPLRLFIVRTYAADLNLVAYGETVAAFLSEVDQEFGEVSALLAAKVAEAA